MKLSSLLVRVPTLGVQGRTDRDVFSVTRDSRKAQPKGVFVAVKGARVDGHVFVGEVPSGVVVAERPVCVREGVTLLIVQDSKRALAEISACLNGDPSWAVPVVGLTGTNGKTTITTLLEEATAHLGWVVGRIGTTGNAIGGVPRPTEFTTPEAPELQALLSEMRVADARAVFMEVSSIGLAQRRVDGTSFHTAVFTNLTQDHLDFHGTMRRYAQAKARLFSELLRKEGGWPRAVLCADDPAWLSMDPPRDRWTYGFSEGCDWRILGARFRAEGVHLSVETPEGKVELRSPLLGRHNALNLVAALAVLRTLDVPLVQAVRALGSVQGVPGRLERVPDPSGRLVVVDYAHSDDALAQVIRALRELVEGEVWVVFGCGGDRDAGKRPLMGRVAEELADHVVITSDNPRSESPQAIADQIVAGLTAPDAARVVLDRAAAIRWALSHSHPSDVVLIAGKGHESYQEIQGRRLDFDDREVARLALEGS